MRLFALPVVLISAGLFAQGIVPTMLSDLQPPIHETSGLLVVDGQVWTHGDSDNANSLYQIDPVTGTILREVVLSNGSNVDWEEVTTDGAWVFVGDIGNNLGNRTNLRIYRFPLAELTDEQVTSVQVDTIRFAYADQTDFTPANQATNWDCEAFLAMDDSLFLFTKNWVDLRTHLYILPASPGDHLAQRRDTLDAMGLITGATYDAQSGVIALIGYTPVLTPFVWRLSDYDGHAFFDGVSARYNVQLGLTQMEAIAWEVPDTAYLSNESGLFGTAHLWSAFIGAPVQQATTDIPVRDVQAALRPNPANAEVRITGISGQVRVRILDEHGVEVLQRELKAEGTISVQALAAGAYAVELINGSNVERHRLVIVR